MISRPTINEWLINVARATSERSTCLRRSVGCVLADKQGRILSTGYNGVPRGFNHCNEEIHDRIKKRPHDRLGDEYKSNYPNACPGAFAESGRRLEECHAIHAEMNALLQCKDIDTIHTCYVTHFPCVHCVKMLLNTSCVRIVYQNHYSHQERSEELWREKKGNSFVQI